MRAAGAGGQGVQGVLCVVVCGGVGIFYLSRLMECKSECKEREIGKR